jgi:hypothetical protein
VAVSDKIDFVRIERIHSILIMETTTMTEEQSSHRRQMMDSIEDCSSSKRISEHLEDTYIQSLTPKEKKAYEIAKAHLGMTFQLKKSVGYQTWLKQQVAPS